MKERIQSFKQQNTINLEQFMEEAAKGNLEDFMRHCHRQNTRISACGKEVDAEWLMEVREQILHHSAEKLRRNQKEGIQKALARKAAGTGKYGRPQTKLPEDFKEQIKKRMKKRGDLIAYCKELKMKRSTFYKWANTYI